MTKDTNVGHEWAITVLVCGNSEKLTGIVSLDEEKISRALDVHIHVGSYIPMVFGVSGAHLALVGRGRIIASAKHLDWVRSVAMQHKYINGACLVAFLGDLKIAA